MRSSISCSREQRETFNEIKREIAQALGKKTYEITDREILAILLSSYRDYRNQNVLSLAREIANQLEGVISLLNIAEDYERLKEEVRKLREENAELRNKLGKEMLESDYETTRRAFLNVLRKEIDKVERNMFKRECEEALDYLDRITLKPIQFLLKIHTAFIEPTKAIEEEEKKRKQTWSSEAGFHYGGRVW